MTAIAKLKDYLVKTLAYLEKEQLRIWKEKNAVYGCHGGVSDEAEDDRKYRELEISYANINGQMDATRGALSALNGFAVHAFTDSPERTGDATDGRG